MIHWVFFNLKCDNMVALQYKSINDTVRILNSSNTILADLNSTLSYINSDITSSTPNASRTLTLESTNALGSSSILLKSRGTNTCTINSTGTGMFIKTENAFPINFTVNNTGGTSAFTPLIIQANGVVNMANNNTAKNRMITLF